jgi:hypothetical protein
MRTLTLLAVAIAIVAIGFTAKNFFVTGSAIKPAALAASITLAPHEIHLNYRGLKELPVHDSKNAF